MPPLPPLNAVRVFEAAARLENFSRAAEELAMTQAGVSYQIKLLEERIGAALFIAAGLSHALAERARRSEALARRRTWELLETVELNQGIIQHLQSGVIVVDRADQVQLLNDTARELLDSPLA